MKNFSRIILAALAVLLFTACNAASTPNAPTFSGDNPYAVQPGDGNMLRGEVRIDSSSLSLTKSLPPQAVLNFDYFQPTPCYSLRVDVNQPDTQNRINLEAYAVTQKDKVCTLMALSTPLHASLNLGNFSKGHYSVWLNGVKVDEFDA